MQRYINKENIINFHHYHLKVILLAAGKSTRFGGIKLIANINKQSNEKQPVLTLIELVLNNISAALQTYPKITSSINIATGEYHLQIAALLKEKHIEKNSLLYCNKANEGLGKTIAQAVEKVIKTDKNISHIMIALADQVALNDKDYEQLIKQSIKTPHNIVCAKAKNRLMAPAIFPYRYFTELTGLNGDKGAQAILKSNSAQLHSISLDNAIIDIDTQQDLHHWNTQ